MEKDLTRRDFLASTGAAIGAGAVTALGAPAIGRALGTANDRIVLGLIGCGGQGRHDMNCFMGLPEVTCHLTNLSHLAGRSIRWDPAKEVVVGDDAAMRLGSFAREYRAPWKLPRYEG
jgi:hypothetical protein